MIEIDNKCTACGACAAACPKHCITVTANNTGFMYPHINTDKCVNCHMCEGACHLNRSIENHFEPKAYAVRANNQAYLRNSTSGGAFSALAEYVLNSDGVVYGCAYVDHLKAKHIRIETIDDLHLLNGSKYVQSDCSDSFIHVRQDLLSKRPVLFSGTPCQVSSLRSFLGIGDDNLITVDIVCHGVTSQAFFDKYIEWYENKNNINVTNYDFRSKQNAKWSLAGVCVGEDRKTNQTIKKKVFYYNEYYYYYFLKGLAYRESCYQCRYANMERPGDITLGDMWGAESLDLGYDTSEGCSLYIANSEKALRLLELINVTKKKISIEQATKLNKQLTTPSKIPERYKEIVDFISASSAEEIDQIFRRTFRKERLVGFVKYHVPNGIKMMIKGLSK